VFSFIEGLEGRVLLHGGHWHELSGPAATAIAPTTNAAAAAPALEKPFHLRINAGGGRYRDGGRNLWRPDRYFQGGIRVKRKYDVGGIAEERLFAQHRRGVTFTYAIPVPSGAYTLNLLFADPVNVSAGQRVFHVLVEGQLVLADFDVAANGGGLSAITRYMPVTVADGTLNVTFQAVIGEAIVSGVELFTGPQPPPATFAWQEAASAPTPLFEGQGAVVADRLYLFGGFVNGAVQATQAVHSYDPVASIWTPRASMPTPLTHAGVAIDGSHIWVVGGLVGDYNGGINPTSGETWRYDTILDAWNPGPSLPHPSGAGGLVVVGRKMHSFGGLAADAQSDSPDHWVLDLDAANAALAGGPPAQWTAAAPMPVPRNHFGATVVNDKIYAIGGEHGRDETNSNLRDVHVYDPATDRWAAAARLPKPMSHFHPSTVAVNGRILIAGGVTNGRAPLSDVWEYNPLTNRWLAAAQLPAPRKAPVMALIGNVLYVIGGSPGDNFPQPTVWFRAV